MVKGNLSSNFLLKNISKIRNYSIEEINQNDLVSKKHKQVYTDLSYIERLLFLAFVVTKCVSISSFASLVGISVAIAGSAVELKICAITAGIKMYKSIIKKA